MTVDPRILEAALAPDIRLDDILALASSRYPVEFESVHLGAMSLDLLQIADLPAYIDRLAQTTPAGQKLTLPFWAKLWPASFPLAMLAARLGPGSGPVLEIGAGLGLCGLAAAMQGLETWITDIEPESLLFIRASILKNGLERSARAERLDLCGGSLEQTFGTILASEALYLPALHEPLAALIERQLTPGGGSQALFSCDMSREASAFLSLAQPHFRIQRTQTAWRADDGDPQTCVLYRMTRPH